MKYIISASALSIFLVLITITICLANGQGEVVLITGASSGIGYNVAKVLGSEGYKVVVTGRRVTKLNQLVEEIKEMGGHVMAVSLDVTKETDYERAFAAAEAAYGGVDHTFLNAGVFTQGIIPGSGLDTVDMNWATTQMQVNQFGAIAGMKHSIRALRKRGGGSIILVGSMAGSLNRFQVADAVWPSGTDSTIWAGYCMTKAAIDMLSRFGRFYMKEGIRVYNIKPAIFASEIIDHEVEHNFGGDYEAFASRNPFFTSITGDPVHIARTAITMFNNSTQYECGSNVVIDNDGTFDSRNQYDVIEHGTGNGWSVTAETLRGYDGGKYTCQSQKTCDFYNKKISAIITG